MAREPARVPAPVVLDDALCAFVRGGVSIGLATRDARLRPHVVRAVGVRHDDDRVIVLVPRDQATDVLADLADNGRVAVVFNQPHTHRTYQLKGADAVAFDAGPEDRAAALAYRDAFGAALEPLGWPRVFTDALLEGLDGDLVGIAFVPDAAFIGTPGPQAGDPLRAGEDRDGRG